MKLIREHINEKFVEDSDPIHDMGIGIDRPRVFDDATKMSKWILKYLPHILKTSSIPNDIIQDDRWYLKEKYILEVQRYVKKYFQLKNNPGSWSIMPDWEYLRKTLKRKGYSDDINKKLDEKFTADSDPIHDMGIGIKTFENIKPGDVIYCTMESQYFTFNDKISFPWNGLYLIKDVKKIKPNKLKLNLIPWGYKNDAYPPLKNELFKTYRNKLINGEKVNISSHKNTATISKWKKHFKVYQHKELNENINENLELNKKLIKIVKDSGNNDVYIYSVDGAYVKAKLNFIEFIEGGHHYVRSAPGYSKIPKNEIWIDNVFLKNKIDLKSIVLHEFTERNLMLYKGWTYEKAHEYANKKELEYRQTKK